MSCDRAVDAEQAAPGSVDLYWIPLGAGAHVVRLSGWLFEFLAALIHHRVRCDLYHSALIVRVREGRYVVEQAPIPDFDPERRGVVAEGPVGLRCIGRYRLFRYEVRCWRDGTVPDISAAVGSPVTLTESLALARSILELLPSVPTPVWGRDQLGAGEMWNSNSVISWVLTRSGIDTTKVHPPRGGRAPGWDAGLIVAHRELCLQSARTPSPHESSASLSS